MNTKISKTLYTAARIVLGLVFVFSGFVKAIDPRGFGYKIDEYLKFFDISFPQWLNLPLITGIIIIMVEFVLGIYLIIGIRRKFSSYLTLFLTVTFTAISIFILIFKPVEDCGCFGDFLLLSDTQTILKNIVLLALAIFLLPHAGRLPAFVPRNWQWFVSLYTGIFIFVFILRTIYFIPILDFRPYKIGANIRELVFPKNIEDGEVPLDLYITDQSGQDMTADILFETRPLMLVVSPRLIESDSGVTEELNAINDWCTDHEYKMYCVTSSPLAEIKEWSYYNDIQYTILLGDHTTLKTIVRSNPGLLLLRDGVVRNKWSCHNLPDVSNKTLKETQLEAQPDIFAKTLLKFMLWYLLPILFLILISNLVHHLQRKMSRKSTN